MKRILITGASSYIGRSLNQYLSSWPQTYHVEAISVRGEAWTKKTFSAFDVVVHVAGLAHQPGSKDDPEYADDYDRINHRLAVAVAKKAKTEGVKQFLFLSSESVYGLTAAVGNQVMITKDTPAQPVDNYGSSKLKAEEDLLKLEDASFRLAILRPPMIYGRGCKGNYQTLAKLARKLPVFPWVENRRSMLYIENLCEFMRLLIDREDRGLFFPQDEAYVCTSRMVLQIAQCHGHHILMVKGLTGPLKRMRYLTSAADKAFGSLCYDRALSAYPIPYCIKNLQEAILTTEQENTPGDSQSIVCD